MKLLCGATEHCFICTAAVIHKYDRLISHMIVPTEDGESCIVRRGQRNTHCCTHILLLTIGLKIFVTLHKRQ